MLEPLKQKLLQTDCSGAFVMLNASVNSTLPEASVSKSGLYLQVSGYERTASEALSCGSTDAYFHTLTEDYSILKKDENLSVFEDESFSYLGISRSISLSSDGEHLLVVMIPKTDYDRMLSKSIIQTVIFLPLLQ